ncbi:MAG: homoserine dehydrogenase [Verrucomicrobiae bacterium]|nr:homoserine dehydrogenase [Verrucomicrobiae bacterium]
MREVKIGIAGLGIVGSGVLEHLARNAEIIAQRSGFRFKVVQVAVRDSKKARPALTHWKGVSVTTHPLDLLKNPEIEIIVELMGGIKDAHRLIEASLKKGKGVVTANKALLAEKVNDLLAIGQQVKKPLCFEASVAGGIPILKALREGLVANRIQSIHGIINGTCNFILSSISQTGQTFQEALAEAQKLGFAEADPTLDIEGFDTMHKACLLATLAYGFWVNPSKVSVEGISHLQTDDFHYAKLLGYTIKLLAVIKCVGKNAVEVHVSPTLIPSQHVLASVSGSYNALAVRGDVVGDTLFYGRGAGADATASAVISDLVEAATALSQDSIIQGYRFHSLYQKLKPFEETVGRYYVRLLVKDKPGVLAKVAEIFARHAIGISSVFQPKGHEGEAVPLVLLIHDAKEGDFRSALHKVEKLSVSCGKAVALRLEDFES